MGAQLAVIQERAGVQMHVLRQCLQGLGHGPRILRLTQVHQLETAAGNQFEVAIEVAQLRCPLGYAAVQTVALAGQLPDGVLVLLGIMGRSEEHTSELQSRENLVCRLLLEKKKRKT